MKTQATILVDTLTQAGVVTGPGPLTTCQSLTWTYRRDAAGEWTAVFAASDPALARVALKNTILRFVVGGDFAIAGPVERVRRSIDSRGKRTVVYAGRDMLGELAENTVHALVLASGSAGVSNAPNAIVSAGNVTGRTWTVSNAAGTLTGDAVTTLTAVYKQFNGETVLAALVKTAEEIGEHFRADVTGARKLVWLGLDAPTAELRLIETGGVLLHQNPLVRVIESLVIEDNGERIVNRVYPFGAGNGDARLDLSACTRVAPTGYTLNAAANYIEADGLQSAPGVLRALEVEFKDIRMAANSDDDLASAANALFDAALAYLQRNSDPAKLRAYRLTVRGLPDEVMVGMKIAVQYQAPGELIDQELIILDITRTVDANGRQPTRLTVVPYDWQEMSEAGRIAQSIERAKVYSSHPQAVHNSDSTAYRVYVGEDQTADKAEIRWWFGDEVVRLRRVLVRFNLSPVVTFSTVTAGDAEFALTTQLALPEHQHAFQVNEQLSYATPVGLQYAAGVGFLAHDVVAAGNIEVTTLPGIYESDVPATVNITGTLDLSGAITNTAGIYRAAAGVTLGIDDLEYQVNGGGWADLNTATSAGGGWYKLDITAACSDADTRRPLQETNTLEVRRKTAGATGKTVMLDVALNVVSEIQALAFA